MKILPSFIFVAMSLFFCLNSLHAESSDATLLQILSDPVKYHKKMVRVVGYLHLKRYDDAIYLHEEDFRHALYGNSLWVDVTDDMRNHEENLTDRYVILEGLFDAESRGTMGAFTGTIKNVRRCEAWSSETRPANPYSGADNIVMTSGDAKGGKS